MSATTAQRMVIFGSHPAQRLNGSHRHWSVVQKQHDAEAALAYWHAKQAGWVFVPGKVRLTVTFVYPQRYGGRLPDPDGMAARCKGLLDGLKAHFFDDDSSDVLELLVRAEVRPGVKQTELTLEPCGTSSNEG